MKITKEIIALAIGIALLPPLWAVMAPYIGVTTGAVALICAGVYVANGNKVQDGLKIMLGFFCGDLWAVLALGIMNHLTWNANVSLFVTLCVLGFVAVILATICEKFIFLPSWLCGWAIGLTIMTPDIFTNQQTLPIQIAAAMAVGVWYVGAGVDWFSRFIRRMMGK